MKIIIFGNSGSGKSTLALKYKELYALAHLDLDTLAWEKDVIKRRPLHESLADIEDFIDSHDTWLIEGGYDDLIEPILQKSDRVFFLNPGLKTCLDNAQNRPFEAHKYTSKEAQDKNLEMLLEWIKAYYTRDGAFSYVHHQKLFQNHSGEKYEYQSNADNQVIV